MALPKRMKIIKYSPTDIDKVILFLQSLEDGWDNHDSAKISQKAITTLDLFFRQFSHYFILRNGIYAVPGGGIALEFLYEERQLSLEIFEDGCIKYEKLEMGNGSMRLVEAHWVPKSFALSEVHCELLFRWLIT